MRISGLPAPGEKSSRARTWPTRQKKAGVEHLIYSSVGGAERNTGITHWETKWQVEKYIRSLKLPVTVLRPVSFMETYHILDVEVGLLKGKLADPIRGDTPYQTIATDDIVLNEIKAGNPAVLGGGNRSGG